LLTRKKKQNMDELAEFCRGYAYLGLPGQEKQCFIAFHRPELHSTVFITNKALRAQEEIPWVGKLPPTINLDTFSTVDLEVAKKLTNEIHAVLERTMTYIGELGWGEDDMFGKAMHHVNTELAAVLQKNAQVKVALMSELD
jgi:hypothetical protein